MTTMRLHLLFVAPFLATGCAPLYEEVPAYGVSDPNQVAAVERQPRPQPQYAIQSQEAVDPGQAVNVDVGQQQDQQDQEYADTDPSALTEFKSTLDPYGTWQDDNQYGTVWEPDPGVVGNDFAPYVTGGHWGYDDGYTWVSDYDWGWAPFHYGRWVYIANRGWCWIPGRRYAGAWVNWRVGPAGYGYVGWGPMAPSWYWRGGHAYEVGWNVGTPYTFCHSSDLFSPTLHGRTIGGAEVANIGANTRPYTDGRTPAHPTVGPPLSHLGVLPPSVVERSPGILRARALAHPAGTVPSQVPYTAPRSLGSNPGYNYNPPVVTAPRYNGVVPQPYHAAPMYHPPQYDASSRFNTQPHWGGPSQMAPRWNGTTQIGPRYTGPTYSAPRSYSSAPPVHYGGGSSFGGGGGGWHAPSSSFSSSSSSHSYTHSHGGGGGHGHR